MYLAQPCSISSDEGAVYRGSCLETTSAAHRVGIERVQTRNEARPDRALVAIGGGFGRPACRVQFLRSDGVVCVYNVNDEIDYLFHLRLRFPDEPRFQARRSHAAGVESETSRQGQLHIRAAAGRPGCGGRSHHATRRQPLPHAGRRPRHLDIGPRRVEDAGSVVIYLARYFKGQALERKKRPAEAEKAYRGALRAVPAAQSASMALAALLFKNGQRTEASRLMDMMFAASPRPADPWRGYADADDRFWPLLIGQLRGGDPPMRWYALRAMTVALLCTATTRSEVPALGQQPTFRSGTDLVSVDVIVRVAGDAVGGLTASDFALRDNGVPQRIESTEATAVPVDVSLVVDVSGGHPSGGESASPGGHRRSTEGHRSRRRPRSCVRRTGCGC